VRHTLLGALLADQSLPLARSPGCAPVEGNERVACRGPFRAFTIVTCDIPMVPCGKKTQMPCGIFVVPYDIRVVPCGKKMFPFTAYLLHYMYIPRKITKSLQCTKKCL
jgi:hypothetical protein